MRGKGSLSHNSRQFIAENVDSSRTPLNIEYHNEDIRAVYHELFDDALAHYNEKQTRRDRVIDDYYEKIRMGKQEKLFEELIIQIGNKDDMNASSENGQLARQMLDEYMQSFQQRNPTLRVFSAHLHMDEATPHLHIDFIPFTTGSKRGLETRVSLKKALEALGFTGGTKSHTELNQWIESEKQALASIMARHDIEWEQKGTHEEHLSVLDYKKQERSKEVAALETQIDALQEQTATAETMLSEKQEQLDDIAPILKNTEKFVRKYDDPERLLPEAGMLESGKAFREKKALPILGKLLKYARSLFRENTELKAKVQKLEKENTAFKSANWNHTHEMVRLKTENQELHKAKDKLDALVGRIGNDVLQKALEGISKEHSKSQKNNKDEISNCTQSCIECMIRKLGKKVDIEAYPHKFRRTAATNAVRRGMPIEQVQKLLGHVKIETTMHYAMVNQSNVKISHRKYIG